MEPSKGIPSTLRLEMLPSAVLDAEIASASDFCFENAFSVAATHWSSVLDILDNASLFLDD